MTPHYDHEVAVARSLAVQAGAVALTFHERDLEVEFKRGNEPVTIADREASRVITQGLARAFPGDIVISEEKPDNPRRLTARRVWYVDPIDGTKDFIRGLDGFSVMIGLTVAHRPVLGVVYQPTFQRMYFCDGRGSFYQAPGREPTRISVSSVSEMADIRLAASPTRRPRKLDLVKSSLGISDEFNVGSFGLKLAFIAAAERDLYVNPASRCKSWDTCAPEAILVAAGGTLTDVRGDPIRYDERDPHKRKGLIASNGLIHTRVIERMRALLSGA